MKKGDFIWADLSTYNLGNSIQFYEEVLDWKISEADKYYLASISNTTTGGIFETPEYLKKINMPHFWMSYFQVDSTEETVKLAQELHAIVEVKTTDFYHGKIALIRDPQGAGFTIYDGDGLYLSPSPKHGCINKTELHVSDINNVIPFYSKLFEWKFIKKSSAEYIVDQDNSNNISIKEISNHIKGKYEYWVTTILVDALHASTELIIKNGGSIIMEEDGKNLMTDNSGEAFFYIQEKN